jgi:hypothetical protein
MAKKRKKKADMIHGIAVKEKATGEVVDFIKCDVGRPALRVLSGIRINLNHEDYEAEEDLIDEETYKKLKEEG